ncbi:hypothetical protein AGMMS50262_22180 [Bacteroidia bacterium]|nr:hypothetical protein AGMMS50262_22180 [Bacteroidia bacterium]
MSVIAITTNGTRSFYTVHTDHLGSIRGVITAGKVVQTAYYYDAWGKRTLMSGTPITNRGYLAQEHLDDFGLINLNARLYDPALGRFLSPDPYVQMPGFTQNYNRYAYGLNNPLIYTDANGENPLLFFVIGGALIGSYVGSSIKGGSWNPAKWEGNWWQGALWGGLAGAAVGAGIGSVWMAGGSISFGIQAYGLNTIELLSFSAASASTGGGVTMTVGGGLGLGSMLTYTLGRKDEEKRREDITPYDVGVEWLTGAGQRDRTFYDGDYFTELLQQHEHIEDTRNMLIDNFRNGDFNEGNNDYKLNGLQGVGKYIKDYSTLATWGKTGNLAVTYLGSYDLAYNVLSTNKNPALVQFTVTNSSSMASGTRPPVIGYWPVWQKYIGPFINKQFSSGPMSQTTQTFIWNEYIYW